MTNPKVSELEKVSDEKVSENPPNAMDCYTIGFMVWSVSRTLYN